MPGKIVAFTLLTLVLVAPNSNAAKVFLNGVDITDVKDKTFSKVKKVHIDDKGDVHIDAPQYEVQVLETGAKARSQSETEGSANSAGLKSKYFIASQGPAKKVQYELTVEVNDAPQIQIGATKSSVIREITDWLKKGKNVIRITARKKIGPEGRASTSKADEVSVLIGSGYLKDKVVKIDSLKATFKCDASTTNTFTREYTVFAE